MNWLLVTLIALFIILVVVLEITLFRYIFRKLNISMTGGMPKAVLWTAFKNGGLTALLLFGIYASLTFVFMYVFHQSIKDSFVFSFGSSYAVTVIYTLIKWYVGKQRTGAVVFEISPTPINRNVFFLNIPIFLIFGFFIACVFDLGDMARIVAIVTGFLMVIFNLLYAMGKLQICENGIWVYLYLVKWAEIESYSWAAENEKYSPLRITIKIRLPLFMRNGALMIPVEKKEMVAALLDKYILGSTSI